MWWIRRAFARFYKGVCKLTVCQLLWILTTLILYVVIVIWRNTGKEDFIFENNTAQAEKTIAEKHFVVTSHRQVIVWWNLNHRINPDVLECPNNIKCEIFGHDWRLQPEHGGAYLFYASNLNFSNLPLPRHPENVVWGLYHEESPRNVQELMHEKALSLFNFSSTFSRHSDVPFPLFTMELLENITSKKYFVDTSLKTSLLDYISPVIYIQTDCDTSTERDAYVRSLMEYLNVDSYGLCLNNKKLPYEFTVDYLNHLNDDAFLHFFARYKFAIAIENGVCDDYVTEKLWRAIHTGVVPIYFGSPLVRDWLPNNKSAVLLLDYPTPRLLSEHIKLLMSDDNLYEEYLEHKTKGIITNKKLLEEYNTKPYQVDIAETNYVFECFICKKLHDMKERSEVKTVNKKHYNCPKPISALNQEVNPRNPWVEMWESYKVTVDSLYQNVLLNSS